MLAILHTTARFPEAESVLGARTAQELVDLGVDVLGAGQILLAALLGLDQVVAVDGGRDLDLWQA